MTRIVFGRAATLPVSRREPTLNWESPPSPLAFASAAMAGGPGEGPQNSEGGRTEDKSALTLPSSPGEGERSSVLDHLAAGSWSAVLGSWLEVAGSRFAAS